MAVESLLIVYLSLLFGFRPATVMRMNLSAIVIGEHALGLTEAFRKGYTAKNVPLRRMTIPWTIFP